MLFRSHAAEAREKKHMTAGEAAAAARRAGATRLALVHVSPRYTLEDEARLAAEAREIFPGAAVGRGLQRFDLPLPDRAPARRGGEDGQASR